MKAAAMMAALLIGSAVNLAGQDPCDVIVIGHVITDEHGEGARIIMDPPPTPPECAPPRRARVAPKPFTTVVRPAMLAYHIDSFAGQQIRMPYARVIGVLQPDVFVVDSRADLPPIIGNRARVLVFVSGTSLRVDPTMLVGQTVTVTGVARTLLGMQVSAEVPWPAVLTPDRVEHLEIKAAVLAKSVQTADGVDLTLVGGPAIGPRK